MQTWTFNMYKLSIKVIVISIVIMPIILFLNTRYHENSEVRFVITSEGSTATTWLASILNSIPEINCTHYNQIGDEKNQSTINVVEKSLTDYFSQVKKYAATQKIIGNIHGYTLDLVLQKNTGSDLRIANIIRHPISHIASIQAYWLKYAPARDIVQKFITEKNLVPNKVFPTTYHHYAELDGGLSANEAIEYANQIAISSGEHVPDDLEAWTFLLTLGRFQRVHDNMRLAAKLSIPQYKFEEFTKNHQVLSSLIAYISHERVKLTRQDIDKLLRTPEINTNQQTKLTPMQQYQQWSKWQKVAFYLHLKKIGGLESNAYTDAGYDLSFINSDELGL